MIDVALQLMGSTAHGQSLLPVLPPVESVRRLEKDPAPIPVQCLVGNPAKIKEWG